MAVMEKETDRMADDRRFAQPDSDPHGFLQVSPSAEQSLASDGPREWVFPGADEHFRGIYTRAGTGFRSEVVAICSAIKGEGKTTLSVGLSITLAQDFPEHRVLLVETDFQNPVLAEDFALAPNPGLIDCMHTGEPIQNALRPTFLDN